MQTPEEGKVRVAFAELIDLAAAAGPFTHVRLNIFPDGGISRLRGHGRPA